MKYILYCAIRKKSLINETLYSIASINAVAKINQYTIVIVTDMPECFKQELRKKFFLNFNNIIIEPVSKAMVDNWIGESQYIYRVKIKAIELFFYKYKDNVCFLDCNIFVKRDFDSLFDLIDQNYFIMFDQYVINNREIIKILFPNYRPGTIDYIKHDYIEVNTANQHYKISLDSSFFLSAVLGINYEYRALLSQVLQFNDNLFNITGFSSSEELAFSEIFNSNTTILTAGKFFSHLLLDHYYGRFLLGYIFGFYGGDDEERLKEFLSKLGVNYSFLDKLGINYKNYRYALSYIIQLANREPTDLDCILLNGIKNNYIENTREDRRLFYQYYKKRLEKL